MQLGYSFDNASGGGYNNIAGVKVTAPAKENLWKLAFGPLGLAMIIAGGYPTICFGNDRCKTCKDKCKNQQGLKWGQGGRECFKQCGIDYAANSGAIPPTASVPEADSGVDPQEAEKSKTTTYLIVGGIGLVVLVGGFFLVRSIVRSGK